MSVLIVASDKAELKAFGDEFIKVVSGVGPVLSASFTSSAIERFHPSAVVSVGSAGSFGRLMIGDVVSFGSVIYRDADLTHYGLKPGETLTGNQKRLSAIQLDSSSAYVLSTSASFASAAGEGDAADMEAYGVAAAAYMHGIPCFAVKAITDIVGKSVDMREYTLLRSRLMPLIVSKVKEILS